MELRGLNVAMLNVRVAPIISQISFPTGDRYSAVDC